jgi:hypothetical protein
MNFSNLKLRRTDLYLTEEFVWVEIPSSDGFTLLKGNLHFAPDTTADTLKRYFGYLERVLNSHNFRVLLLGDFLTLQLETWVLSCHSHYTTTVLTTNSRVKPFFPQRA